MIKRLVILPIKPESSEAFVHAYREVKPLIQQQAGCRHLELLQGTDGHFITLSVWDSEADLNAYRQTALFERTWKHVKTLFNGKASAYTTQIAD